MSKKRNQSTVEDMQASKRLDNNSQESQSQSRPCGSQFSAGSVPGARMNNVGDEIQYYSDEFHQNQATSDTDSSSEDENEATILEPVIIETKSQKSWIWEHFKLFKAKNEQGEEKRAFCQEKNCKKYFKFTGSTTRCISHLKTHNIISKKTMEMKINLKLARISQSYFFNI